MAGPYLRFLTEFADRERVPCLGRVWATPHLLKSHGSCAIQKAIAVNMTMRVRTSDHQPPLTSLLETNLRHRIDVGSCAALRCDRVRGWLRRLNESASGSPQR